MKILKRKIIKGQGFVQMIPTEEEDLWHIYNLIHEGDKIKSITTRKVVSVSQTGVKNAQKKRIVLTLKIVKISYHASDHLALEIKGINVEKNDYLSLNQFHTFTVDLDTPITIIKNDWYGYHFKILKELSDPAQDTDVAALVMDEGIGHLCFVKSQITLMKQKIEKSIPKKRQGASGHDTEMQKFYKLCFDAIMLIDFRDVQCLILASPGTIKDDFLKYIKEQAMLIQYQQKFKQLAILQKIICVKSSTGYLNSLNEALQDPSVINRLQDTKAIKQIKIFDEFYKELSKDENMVAYSEKSVIECYKQQAIKKLLISDKLFRTKDLNKRRFFNGLVDSIARQGGETYIFSSLHKSGENLNNLSGIAAILKFPVILDDDEDESEDEEQEQNEEDENGNQKKQQNQHEEQKKQEKSKKKFDIDKLDIGEDEYDDDEDNGEEDDDFQNYKMEDYNEEEEEQKK
ncbi:hypothetical protein PPERSA_11670 [Pseudocohnilembus persalinus]|uniref:Eukaryotic peptide chain release factor subunit 1 n=1 Tax=Pseudocohnilembus persalinus TaxID=266149 RepID=A0A0V0QA03_PSEPJ|nr:hypothetical protein PPERSA_11670 [Pseudocohnilembus persalinus]|eukprot:KRW99069.1 hypothetical protein PPERSA_11670 [Pseudocohnilembus persalinus]